MTQPTGTTSRTPTGTMKAVVVHGPRDYRLEEVPIPTPGPGQALLKVEAVGICASDLKCYHGAAKFWGDESRPAWAETQTSPGHEFTGRVVAIDAVGSARWGVVEGDRVVAEQIVPCWDCRYCNRGDYHMCQPHDMFGFKRRTPGAMAEYVLIPEQALLHVAPGDLPPAHVAFAEPLSCSLHAVERAGIRFDDTVVVAGCGPIGLGMIAGAAAKFPARVIALDALPHKLELARKCGADLTIDITKEDPVARVKELTGGYGADVYIEATGHPAAVAQGLNLLRKLGTFVEYSVFKEPVSVDWSIISDDKELNVLGAHLGQNTWPAALRMIASGRLPLEEICSHQLPLEEFQRGLDLVADSANSVKVSLIP